MSQEGNVCFERHNIGGREGVKVWAFDRNLRSDAATELATAHQNEQTPSPEREMKHCPSKFYALHTALHPILHLFSNPFALPNANLATQGLIWRSGVGSLAIDTIEFATLGA